MRAQTLILLVIALALSTADAVEIIDAKLDSNFEGKSEEVDRRIVGGAPVELGQLPYFAFIQSNFAAISIECGGGLIVYNWVLTAAHCMPFPTFQVQVALGFVNRNAQPIFSSGPLFSDSYVTHPNFNVDTLSSDIALVRIPTQSTILLNPNIGLIPLPETNDGNINLVGNSATVGGFGEELNVGQPSQVLNQVTLNIVANSQCQQAFPGLIGGSHICTANPGAVAACFGDGGGPLVTQITIIRRAVVGIVTAFGFPDCTRGAPGSFTRVTSFLTWINGIIGGGGGGTTTTSPNTTTTTPIATPPTTPTTTTIRTTTTTRRSGASKSTALSMVVLISSTLCFLFMQNI